MRTLLTASAFFALLACAAPATGLGEKVLRVVPQSDLEILDPVFTTATVTQNHGFMIYDTLFGMDANGRFQPQMVDHWDVSKDRKVWTFVLREGLGFHDGAPVTSDDVIASLQRWGERDGVGQVLLSFVQGWDAVDPKTFRMRLKAPYGLVLESFGKPSSPPFIMPKRVASTSGYKQIDDYTGSGPFVFKKEEWKPGDRVVYARNPRYAPRPEPASGTAGGKMAKVDRVEWVIIKDPQLQANALAAGEVDMIEFAPFELYPTFRSDPHIQLTGDLDIQFILRFNHLEAPFNNPRVRQAAMAALNQAASLEIQVGIPERYRVCFSVYPCRGRYATTSSMDFIARPDPAHARELLRQSGYDGAPVVVMQPADQVTLVKLAVVAAQLLRQAGFKVDMQSMTWQQLVARRAKKQGWSIFMTSFASVSQADPISNIPLGANCDKAWFGWPCDPELERLRDAFARASDEDERKAIAEQVQVRAMEVGTHVPLGEAFFSRAVRDTVKGLVTAPGGLVLWNVEKE